LKGRYILSYSNKFPIRITLCNEGYTDLLNALKANEETFADYPGRISDDAKALREKIEEYGRRETGEDGEEIIHLGFFGSEGVKFIGQFLAAAEAVKDLQAEIISHERLAKTYESLIKNYQSLIELYEEDINDTEAENGNSD
jgi:hypothetical protein